jgi:hypothetical protein
LVSSEPEQFARRLVAVIEKDLPDNFRHKAVERGNSLFFDVSTALEVVEYCKEHGLGVAGIDGFVIEPEATVPLMNYMTDWSSFDEERNWQLYVDKSTAAAVAALTLWWQEGVPKDFKVDVVVISETDHVRFLQGRKGRNRPTTD